MARIAIIGTGLMGIALIKAIKNKYPQYEIVIYDNNEELRKAVSKEFADSENVKTCSTPQDAAKNSDIIILSTTIDKFAEVTSSIKDYIKEGAVVTDIGSVKTTSKQHIESGLGEKASQYIGSHPIAGGLPLNKESTTSLKESIAKIGDNIFAGKNIFVTGDNSGKQTIIDLWQGLGAKTVESEAQRHDEIMSYTSHTPHFLAMTFLLSLSDEAKSSLNKFLNSDSQDAKNYKEQFLRNASKAGNADMWAPIFIDNKNKMNPVINSVSEFLSHMQNLLENNKFNEVIDYLNEIDPKYKDKNQAPESKALEQDGFCAKEILPQLLGAALTKSAQNLGSDIQYAGVGFHSFVNSFSEGGKLNADMLAKNKKPLLNAIKSYNNNLLEMTNSVDIGEDKIRENLQNIFGVFQSLTNTPKLAARPSQGGAIGK